MSLLLGTLGIVAVSSAAELTAAVGAAAPGDEIVLASGTYAFTSTIDCRSVGTAAQPIVVRSASPLGARIEFAAVEGFLVTGAGWQFEGLDVHGTCPNDTDCDNAFHVVGAATGFVMRGNRVVDFNAQLKVNASQPTGTTWVQPNGGLVEGNEVFDTHARATSNPVTKLDIDGVDDWVVRANVLHDGYKNGGDFTSYQAFMKGGGKRGLFERNLVLCTRDLAAAANETTIGLSFGGGGTGPQFCAPAFDPNVPCAPEMSGGTMRNNIIANCSDVGIYLNQAADTHVLYNTLVATSGIDFRFATTSGEADGNVLASDIHVRDGATFTAKTNLTGVAEATFDAWWVAPLTGDLRKKGDLTPLLGKAAARADVADDYCARARGAGAYDLGALQVSLGDCALAPPPAPGVDGGASDAGTDASSADAGDDAASPDAPSSASSGCSCRTAPREDAPRLPSLLGLVALLGLVCRRRMSRQRPDTLANTQAMSRPICATRSS